MDMWRWKVYSPFLMAVLFSLSLSAGETRYGESGYTKEAPVIEGDLDDLCWAGTQPITDFRYRLTRAGKAVVQTEVRIVWDETNLYAGVKLWEPNVKGLVYDPSVIWKSDSFKLYFDPRKTRSVFTMFIIDWKGRVSQDVYTGVHKETDRKYPLGIRLKDGYWTIEMAIPWKDLGFTPKRGEMIGFHTERDRWASGQMEMTEWNSGGHQNSGGFGYLVVGNFGEYSGYVLKEVQAVADDAKKAIPQLVNAFNIDSIKEIISKIDREVTSITRLKKGDITESVFITTVLPGVGKLEQLRKELNLNLALAKASLECPKATGRADATCYADMFGRAEFGDRLVSEIIRRDEICPVG